ncbi:Carbohydrate-binding x8 domain-containing protein [Thalictrum thalictroides]|uniref:Carbohydrate-binding x8 domain-containing protein n=1 Tax=Thalictrum thalictroides TaxID=46969 RepID=A0A7J6WU65_THATH|nr:Carbohydrate-binding x8 domain-containing protein [Thalictrum thalictroides]
MATSSHNHLLLVVLAQVMLLVIVGTGRVRKVEGAWCVAKSNVSPTQLQTALDYACGAGADCAPITSSGLCFLPNTIQAHASYAFNSYYQRKSNAPGSCDFSSSATIATTDPS